MANKRAPKGKVYQCKACGKRSRDEYGFDSIDYGFDESCVLNAELCDETEAAEIRAASLQEIPSKRKTKKKKLV
jgi:hypothetical protein